MSAVAGRTPVVPAASAAASAGAIDTAERRLRLDAVVGAPGTSARQTTAA